MFVVVGGGVYGDVGRGFALHTVLLLHSTTVLVLRMAHRIWKETKQLPGTAGTGSILGCCLVSCGPSYVRRLQCRPNPQVKVGEWWLLVIRAKFMRPL